VKNVSRQTYILIAIILISIVSFSIYAGIGRSKYQPKSIYESSSFNKLTGVVPSNDGSNDLYILEQQGIIKKLSVSSRETSTFFDLTNKIFMYDEDGLLGLAFHPNYTTNGYFYVFYSDLDPLEVAETPRCTFECARTVLSRFQSDNNIVNYSSEKVLLTLSHNEPWHRAGNLMFGQDNYLYLSTGDSNVMPRAQTLDNLYGKVLRIDINTEDEKYLIPPDNPFIGFNNSREEVFALGLRNPWRGSFDHKGRLWLGDVGLDRIEEINIIEKGNNYGWPVLEGYFCNALPETCDDPQYKQPFFQYTHNNTKSIHDPYGIAIVGGVEYHGESYPDLVGKFVFADHGGKVWAIDYTENLEINSIKFLFRIVDGITSIGTDEDGEILIVGFLSGRVYKIELAILTILRVSVVMIVISLVLYKLVRLIWNKFKMRSQSNL